MRPISPPNMHAAGLDPVAAAGAQAMECLRLAQRHRDDTAHVLKCAAMAARMLREARATRALLERVQAARHKPEATTAPGKAASPTTPALPRPIGPAPSLTAEADTYAREHRKRAVLIRRHGGVPHRLNFGPLKRELIRQIVTGDTPILRSLDAPKGRIAAAA
jgi:hypothetical protein